MTRECKQEWCRYSSSQTLGNKAQTAKYTPYTRRYDLAMSSSDLVKLIKKAGWQLNRVNGSHHVFTHPQRSGIVVVPHPKKDLGKGLVKAIRQQAGV